VGTGFFRPGCDPLRSGRILWGVDTRSAFVQQLPERLIGAARRGDEAAWSDIYRRFEAPVYTLALRMTGHRDEAAEVLHDTMLKVFEGIHGFRGSSPFWAWVRQIAVNTALMRLRRAERLQFSDEPPEPESGTGGSGDWLPPAAADAALLRRALDVLPATTRSVLWLYHAEGYTHEEIGRLMGHGASFSKSRVSRGTRQLRELLGVTLAEVNHA
jgi:RNA polymerase sigma factor (sigma-70 family)